jgi:hypothetical protein
MDRRSYRGEDEDNSVAIAINNKVFDNGTVLVDVYTDDKKETGSIG